MAKKQRIGIPAGSFDPDQEKRMDLWTDQLSKVLKPGRFAHSLSVAETSFRLAGIHGLDTLRAAQAGLLHDCAKHLSLKEMQKIAVENSLTGDAAFLSSAGLLHSLVGAWIAEKQYGMEDAAVLQAIRYHNTGCPGMTRLDMCVCLSDSIEPLRESFPRLEEIRALSLESIERSLLLSLESTANYVLSRGLYLHPQTQKTIQWLKSLPETVNDQ